MADLANDIRLAVDSGETALGINKVIDSIKGNTAKLIIAASINKTEALQDVMHLAKISDLSVITFEGNSLELGAICGKPFSVSVLSIIKPGNSSILNQDKDKEKENK
ncbi:50S ribosomal protein L30e [Candidatus Marsarchaeota archaeon]|jgi:large subunit ribosomal protein L30e|nr:50S ribosomal protein L30e [Candidatus Marsarchaeota archaeon]MCL5092783.1 50S ribosomal protein L30e [Candidatus Marsarchaeota archaeon]